MSSFNDEGDRLEEADDLLADASVAAVLTGFKNGCRVEVCMETGQFERWLPGVVESTTPEIINVALDAGGVVGAYIESVRHEARKRY